ncbi:MAG TPA: ABC transporter ATP-binding protein, partial [Candidatus Acidoferrales bacterium]|nr:ABC transporter ATP-binding protein [Candidatus Acidoferrales bacterium]
TLGYDAPVCDVSVWRFGRTLRGQPMENLLQVRNLTVRYAAADARAHTGVDGISFDIAAGEVVGLMGESGSGKSSVALALLGLLPAESTEISGSVLFRGEELTGMRESALEEIRGAAISLVFQEPGISLSPMMRVGEQIAEVIHAHRRWNWRQCQTEAEQMLARVGLTPTARIFAAYPHQLSGGQRQRVVLAQALACEPALLIADEPTASLDARSQADFIALLRSLKEQARISILLISHTPEIQASLADRLIVMKDGRIVEEGDFDELYRNPSDAYTRLMLRRSKGARNSHFDGEPVFAEEQLAR